MTMAAEQVATPVCEVHRDLYVFCEDLICHTCETVVGTFESHSAAARALLDPNRPR